MLTLLNINDRLGDYEVVDYLPGGGQANLYVACDARSGLKVVIKQLSVEPSEAHYAAERAQFTRVAALRIGHPNVIDPLALIEHAGALCQIMPFIEGRSLEHIVPALYSTIDAPQTLAIATGIAAGLHAIHARNIVHRDLKPSNVLVSAEGGVYIIDLGICRFHGENDVYAGRSLLGTPQWISPEQLLTPAHVDHRADIYGLGCIIYYLLTGQPPIADGDFGDVRNRILYGAPLSPRQFVPTVPPILDFACASMMARRPEDRIQSAAEFLHVVNGSAPASLPAACHSCGARIESTAVFCGYCGASCALVTPIVLCLACGAGAGDGGACLHCMRLLSHHRLTFTRGPLAGLIFRFAEGRYDVGRPQLGGRDQEISRRHFHVDCCNGICTVQDAGSANKTYVAGQAANGPLRLPHGCEFRIAGNVATYLSN